MAEALGAATVAAMLVGWIGFGVGIVLRRRQPHGPAAKRDWPSLLGLVLQMAGYVVAWRFQRPPARPFLGRGVGLQAAFLALTAVLAAWSVWAVWSAVRVLGKQWSLQARVLEDHELITGGAFRAVRHPIYSAMIALLVASALAIGDWRGLAAGLALELCGTWLRVRGEERLLREVFGERYDEYAARVPALVPRRLPRLS